MGLYVLDLDDTLIDNQPVDMLSFKLSCEHFGIDHPGDAAISQLRVEGKTAADIFTQLAGDKADEIIQWRHTLITNEEVWRIAEPKPGVRAALYQLHKNGDRIVILTCKQAALARRILEMTGLLGFVETVVTSKQKGEWLAKQKETEAVFLSDDPAEVETASQAGYSAYLMTAPYKQASYELRAISDLYDIAEIAAKGRPSVLVTGATGFIGAHLARALVHDGFEVHAIARSTPGTIHGVTWTDADLTQPLAGLPAVDAIFHLAAYLGQEPEQCQAINVDGFANLLAAYDDRAPAVVFSSSSAVYGIPQALPITEDHQLTPHTPYGESKLAAEKLLAEWAAKTGAHTVIYRYASPYGPGQAPQSVLPIFVKMALAGEPITYYNTGERTQEFIYVQDVVRANLLALQGVKGTYNIGTGEQVSMRELAGLVNTAFGGKGSASKEVPDDSFNMCLDSEKASKDLGFAPAYTLAMGLADYAGKTKQ